MSRFCVVVATAVCCLVTSSYGGYADPVPVTRECSVGRSGVLTKVTLFNGQTSTLMVPCKYLLADIQCGDYQLKVTPGSGKVEGQFSPDTVWVKIVNTAAANSQKLLVRTESARLQKFTEEKVENPWLMKTNNLDPFGLDLADYDSAKQAAVLRKDGVFEVEFSAVRASVVVRCFSDSFSTSQPNTLCGDGASGTSPTEEEILDMVFRNTFVAQRPFHSCPAAASLYQQCAAGASVTRDCDYIFLDKATVDCLAGSGTPLIDHYHRCLETACGVDTSAMDPTLAYINDKCADWLNSACSDDRECHAAQQSTCFKGLCLCTPGYYFSVGQNTCVEDCAEDDLQETFLKYPGSGIDYYNMEDDWRDDEGGCVEWCRNVKECRTVEYDSWFNDCYFQSKAVLDVPSNAWFTGYFNYHFYQKMCA